MSKNLQTATGGRGLGCLPWSSPSLHVAATGPTTEVASDDGLTESLPPAAAASFSFVGSNSDDTSSESSSIGSLSSDEDDDGDREYQSKDDSTGSSSLISLSSIEDSLPIKKGLSSHFTGKSRSFSNLSECSTGNAGDLVKHENLFNKRRRIQIANKMPYKRRASYSSLITTTLPPLLSPEHALEEADEENENDDDDDDNAIDVNFYNEKKINKANFNCPRSFSLFDLRYV